MAQPPFVLGTDSPGNVSVLREDGGVLDVIATPASDISSVVPTTFVFRPGGVAGANVYTSWAALYAVYSTVAGPKFVLFDDSIESPCVIPAGAYNFDNLIASGEANFNTPNGGALVELAAGVTITAGTIVLENNLGLTSQVQATAPITVSGAAQEFNFIIGPETQVSMPAGSAPLISVTSGYCWILLRGGVLGDGTHEVVSVGTGAGGSFQISVVGGGTVTAASVGGAGAASAFYWSQGNSNNLAGITLTTPASTNAAPTYAAQAGAGTGAACAGSGSNRAGQIQLTTGTGPAAGAVAKVTYSQTNSAAPGAVVLTPANANAAAVAADIYVSTNAAGDFIVSSTAALTASTVYDWNYIVAQG